MIVVTGATGKLGRAIVERLVERVPANHVAVSVRDAEKAKGFETLGVRVRQADFAEPASLTRAFEGAKQVLLVSSNARSYGGDPLAQHRSAIDAARAAGAGRIVYTSHMAASSTSAFSPMHDHAATEDMLRQSGLSWTALRNGFYANSAIGVMGESLKTGALDAPSDGKVSWTTHADLAEAAAIILADEGRYDGPTPPLTSSQALDLADLAGIASDELGYPVSRRVQSDHDFRAKMTARGLPPAVVDIALGMFIASRAGEFAAVDPTLERLLRHLPITMRYVIADTIRGKNVPDGAAD